MRALQVAELGEPIDVLKIVDLAAPTPGPGQVCIDVHACALNFPDVLLCQGKYQVKPALPFTPGMEVSGVVSAIGDGVTRAKVGDRVLAGPSMIFGGLVEQTIAPEASVYVIPDSMSFDAASALRVTYFTGHSALRRRANLQAGETLLVHAGAGGVGTAAIQLGKAFGATVIATAGGPDKVAVCRQLGADLAIDYTADDFVEPVKAFTNGHGADVIFDPVGGDVFDKSTKVIAWEGRILIIGFTSGRMAEARTNHVLVKNYSVVGVHWGNYAIHEPSLNDTIHAELCELHAAGKIDPFVSDVVGLADAPSALARLASRASVGKLVVHPQE
jgi:NADPH:quinone reductase